MQPWRRFVGTLLAATGTVALAFAGPAAAAPRASADLAAIACRSEYQLSNVWQGGFTGSVKVTNTGTQPIEDWRLSFDLAPTTARITQAWNGLLISFYAPVRINAPRWAEDLAPGQAHEIGFSGEFVGEQSAVWISNVKLNDTPCSYT
ncbi:hypothetical protein C6361_22560 [Plantactinospora sp. BC1]|uniref:cellulose binding domain-containing protein n=1 Tax=Plantactinospora sp. BC1 TaxID=2108470 RepID=UPI000D1518C2|nr:cellulose binding domain-containing protein [Plantactinospora sp. BC1]AVT31786.1 hypothetical protein C6361_22560 [Plantactinospora sp. BC1]